MWPIQRFHNDLIGFTRGFEASALGIVLRSITCRKPSVRRGCQEHICGVALRPVLLLAWGRRLEDATVESSFYSSDWEWWLRKCKAARPRSRLSLENLWRYCCWRQRGRYLDQLVSDGRQWKATTTTASAEFNHIVRLHHLFKIASTKITRQCSELFPTFLLVQFPDRSYGT